ncbi:hypothetical protein [Sphingomonas sp. VNH70]|uniref:hypothetical protein n=1 Tax=Sphingomonas silueang TaxID=3156617 RepID=UPI0032B5EBC8
MSDTDAVLRATLLRCRRLSDGIDELRPLLAAHLPTDATALDALPLVERIACIALLKRVEQLQDMIARAVRLVATWELLDTAAMTRRDIANWMEKSRFVEDADQWVDLTLLRNRLVHEYPIDEVEQVRRVNQCWDAATQLQSIVAAIVTYLSRKGFAA